jgi:hypothetical protein
VFLYGGMSVLSLAVFIVSFGIRRSARALKGCAGQISL